MEPGDVRADLSPRTGEEMPDKKTIEKARELKKEGKSASAQAGEFVREEIDAIREGKHGARSAKQAIAIGLSEARRAGIDLPPPKKGKYSDDVREKAKDDLEKGREDPNAKPDPTRSRATTKALHYESTDTVSHEALSIQAKSAAKSRSPADRSESAKKAAETRKRKVEK